MSRLILILLLLLGSCGSQPGGGGCASSWAPPGQTLLGAQAPNFILSSLSGEKIELMSLVRQKPTLLVFWATWCPSCAEEIPILNEWTEKYPGLHILGVNVQEPAERIRAFAEKHKIRYPIVFDQEGEVAHQYGLVGIPAAILVSKGGQIIYYGFSLPKNIDQLIAD